MKKNIVFACLCILALGSCKKDYQKLATEFVSNLPDSCVLLAQTESETEHIVYYMAKDGIEFYRKDFEAEKTDTLCPEVSDGQEIKEVLAGKENIMVCANHADVDFQSAELYLYSLKEKRFEKLGEFGLYENESDTKTVYTSTTIEVGHSKILKARTFDYDGKLVKEVERDLSEEVNPWDMLEDVSEESSYQQPTQEQPMQVFYCRKCAQRVAARNTIEADVKARHGCEPAGSSHAWDYIQF